MYESKIQNLVKVEHLTSSIYFSYLNFSLTLLHSNSFKEFVISQNDLTGDTVIITHSSKLLSVCGQAKNFILVIQRRSRI